VLVDLADDWFEVLDQVYRKKYAEDSLKNYAERIKRSRFLLQRGFSGEMIRKFLQQIENKSHT
jgi:RecX family.